MNKREVEKILRKIIGIHESACSDWRDLYQTYNNDDGNNNRMRRGVSHIASVIINLTLNPTIETDKPEELDEVLLIAKKCKEIFKISRRHIRTVIEDGIITNNGVLRVIESNKKVLLRRRPPRLVARYERIDGEVFVVDFVENKLWTENEIYDFNANYNITASKSNLTKTIPFIFYRPNRIEFGESGKEGVYGRGETELQKIEKKLQTISQKVSKVVNLLTQPPILYSDRDDLNEEDLAKLSMEGSTLAVEDPANVRIFSAVGDSAMQSLNIAEQRNLKELQEKTGQTEFTTGITTKASASGSLLREIKESMMIGLKSYEEGYFEFYENIVKLCTKILITTKILENIHINIDEIEIQKFDRDLDAQESIVIYQSLGSILRDIPAVPGKIDLMAQVMKPQIMKLATKLVSNPEELLKSFDQAIEQTKKQMEAQQNQGLQQQQTQQNAQ